MGEWLRGKRVVVTGGTGSIGTELVRQVLDHQPEVVRVLSRDETKQYLLNEELGRPSNLRLLIGDVRDLTRLRRAVRDTDIVFHTAALKHVPSCEYNPFEAVRTNVVGTENLIQACTDAGVQRLVGVSTDKAVSPEHTMGATKLLAEKLLTAVNQWTVHPVTACVRFGNVLGSRGSLVPLVQNMIDRGEPVRLTGADATRFMMTISQAVRLILTACEKARGGDTLILKMPAVRIRDLVHGVIRRHASRRGIDPAGVRIQEASPRAGERLHELLASEDELKRLHDAGDFYVLDPFWRAAAPDRAIPLAEVRSDGGPFLDDPRIDALLDGAGV